MPGTARGRVRNAMCLWDARAYGSLAWRRYSAAWILRRSTSTIWSGGVSSSACSVRPNAVSGAPRAPTATCAARSGPCCRTLTPSSWSTPNAGPDGTGPCRKVRRVLRATASGAAPPIGQAVISVNGRVTTHPSSRCPSGSARWCGVARISPTNRSASSPCSMASSKTGAAPRWRSWPRRVMRFPAGIANSGRRRFPRPEP